MSANTLLTVDNLKTWFDTAQGVVRAVDGVSFSVRRGETFALLGESGCGKSMTALSIMQLIPLPAGRIESGRVLLDGEDLLALPETRVRGVRGGRIAMIFQEPMTSLNPVLTVGDQIGESVRRHQGLKGRAEREQVVALLNAVGIPDPRQRVDEYPHQLSGGMKQRVMIAMALAGNPDLLIADEPTTALDVTIQAQILQLLRRLQQENGMAILLITHDLGVVAEMADRVGVMYAGHLVELADREDFFREPKHPYSQKLFQSVPGMGKRDQPLAVIRGSVPSLARAFPACRFVERCPFAWQTCRNTPPRWLETGQGGGVRCHLWDPAVAHPAPAAATEERDPGGMRRAAPPPGGNPLTVRDLKVYFPVHKGVLKRVVGHVRAVDGVSLELQPGKTLALVGESGSGKTTTGKGILQLIRPTAGSVRFGDLEITRLAGKELRRRRKDIQIIFQDPYSSMNPRMMVGDIIEEGMITQRMGSAAERAGRVDELLEQVGLSPDVKHRYPHEFSGGQRQRICIARALAVDPQIIICDEPTSALDVSVQAQILNLLKRLQSEYGLAYLFITHNLSVVEYLADDVAVMYLGRIVERGTVREVLQNPLHPYTQALLSAVPVIERGTQREVIRLEGDMPSPVNPPLGCYFHPRCPRVMEQCRRHYPDTTRKSDTHETACFLYR